MASPLLETKLHVPRRRRGLVARPRLIERLSRASEPKLTVVSAPAGFGKTTLLAEWLAAVSADGRSVAWLSLDKSDNDPALFWTYLIGALQTAADGVGGHARSLLQSPQPPIEAVLATLLNDLSASSNDLVLVLDDYHVIEAGDVQDGMAFLLEHVPPQPGSLVTVGKSLVAIHDWTFLLGPGFIVGVGNGLILGWLMYRSGLVPRGMALLGLVTGPVLCAAGIAVLFDVIEPDSPLKALAAAPEFVWELSLGVY